MSILDKLGAPLDLALLGLGRQDAIKELLNCVLRAIGYKIGGLLWTAALIQNSGRSGIHPPAAARPLSMSKGPKTQLGTTSARNESQW